MGRGARAALVGLGALAVAGVAWWTMSRPDTGPPVVVAPPRPAARAIPAPTVAAPTTDTGRPLAPPRRAERPPVRVPATVAPPDPEHVYAAEVNELGHSALARRDRLVDCWSAHVSREPDDQRRRFSIELTVRPDGEVGALEVGVPTAPDDALLAECAEQAFADARYARPEQGSVGLVWAVPSAP